MNEIAILGAGPAGMMAALEAVKSGASVHLFDTNPKVGKKLMVTGSGKCNITNLQAEPDSYDTDDIGILTSVLAQLPPEPFRLKLAEMGIFTSATSDGWVYPLSLAAGNVVQLFQASLLKAGVTFHNTAQVTDIRKKNDNFILTHTRHDAPSVFPLLCVASGGKAMPDLGSDGKLFPVLARLGHNLLPVEPALAPVTFEDKTLRSLDGVRLDVETSLWLGDQCLKRNLGNAIFTQWGMNGPAVMNLSHLLAAKVNGTNQLKIDFLHHYTQLARDFLAANQDSQECLPVLLGGFLSQKITAALCKKIGMNPEAALGKIKPDEVQRLLNLLCNYRVTPTGTRGFKYAQLSSGGVPLAEVHADTQESKIQNGLYLAGEVLNVMGPCGGYNLQWAFSSGYAAGRAMAKQAA